MADDIDKQGADVDGDADKLALVCRQRRTSWSSGSRNWRWQAKSIHPSRRQSLARILQQPAAVVAIENHVRGNDDPLSVVGSGGALAVPNVRLRHDGSGIAESVTVDL